MATFHLRGNLIPLCFIGVILFVSVLAVEIEEESEKKIAKREVYYPPAQAEYPTPSYSAPPAYPTPSYSAPPAYPTPSYSAPAPAYPTPQYAPPPTYAVPEYYPVYQTPQPSYYPSYTPYCAPDYDEPATQPGECDSIDQPLSSDPAKRKNCTCAKNASPAGCTIRLCTSADTNAVGCTSFTCICNGPSASPNYCISVLPYPETAVVPYTPTPGGGTDTTTVTTSQVTSQQSAVNALKMQALLAEAKREQLLETLGTSSLHSATNSQNKLAQAMALAKLQQHQSQILDSTSNQDKLLQTLALAKLQQQQNQILEKDKLAQALGQIKQENQLESPNVANVMQLVNSDQLPHKQIFAVVSPQSSSSQTNDAAKPAAEEQGSGGLLGGLLGGLSL